MDTLRVAGAAVAPHQLLVTDVRPVAGPGAGQLQVALAHWLVALVQAPPAGAARAAPQPFAVGAAWPPVPFPAGFVLLGYLDARDLSLA